MRCFAPVALAVLLLPGAARAGEEPTVHEIVDLLDSDDPRDRAWGAWHAGERDLRELERHLWRNLLPDPLRRPPGAGTLGDYWTLDALIRIQSKVPWEILLPHALGYGDRAVAALILLAREPKKNRNALMAVFGQARGIRWLAAGNLLAPQRPKGFVARLLPSFGDLHLEVFVHDRKGILSGKGGGSPLSYEGGGSRMLFRDGPPLPPVPDYDLVLDPGESGTPVAPGRYPVYSTRTLRERTLGGRPGGQRPAEWALRWIADLLGEEEPYRLLIPAGNLHSGNIHWSGAESFRRDVSAERAAVLDRYRKVFARLVEADLLTEEEAANFAPRIEIGITDQRDDRSVPLPNLE